MILGRTARNRRNFSGFYAVKYRNFNMLQQKCFARETFSVRRGNFMLSGSC